MIQAVKLVKVYGDGVAVRALDEVDLTLARGEFVAINGPSGSGKSTLLNLLGTLDQPTSGSIQVDDIDVSTLKGNALADFRRAKIGFIFQLFNLIPTLTALENVILPLSPYRRGLGFDLPARARELLDKVGLANRLHHVPGQLSGGEAQRVAIARALINYPQLVLADEPTGNLDSQSGREILSLLRRLNREMNLTILLVTHDMTIATYTDRVLQLKDGKICSE
jgi:ABC-type lipoprotein export system ATPase subunit